MDLIFSADDMRTRSARDLAVAFGVIEPSPLEALMSDFAEISDIEESFEVCVARDLAELAAKVRALPTAKTRCYRRPALDMILDRLLDASA